MKKFIIAALLIFTVFAGSLFGEGRTPSTLITAMRMNTVFHDGAVLVYVANNTTGVTGLWLERTDAGFKSTLAALLMAYQNQMPLQITYYTSATNPTDPYYGDTSKPVTITWTDGVTTETYFRIKDVRF